ncbi:DNA polymerase epsilon subunit 4-like [Haliotis cracherodii]|uniref:DNA polymerase epsilon subunit 4-like n=1 Tax=Haliotis rufescens TaxID=6454 RepID=UPI001EAFAB09|nr:DNA polymerase epsilon subunit 4-like [Haliotis rufescens]
MAGEDEVSQVVEEEIQSQTTEQSGSDRLFKLPLSRIKHIIKSDPDVSLASQEAVVSLAKAAELFIQMLAKDAATKTLQGKRKTLQRKDLDVILDTRDCYAFLEGVLDS